MNDRRPRPPRGRFDRPWKTALRACLREFLTLLHPLAADEIDLDSIRPIDQLDTELDATARSADSGDSGVRIADLVFHVRSRRDGSPMLAYIEIQSQPRASFPRLVFTRFVRLFDRHDVRIETIVVLSDDRPNWRPRGFFVRGIGSRAGVRFHVIKILDWKDRRDELRVQSNPFAVFVLAVIAARSTSPDAARADEKVELIVDLFHRFADHPQVDELARAIDDVLPLPARLERESWVRIKDRTEPRIMPHLFIWERDALRRGRSEGKTEGKAEGLAEGILRVARLRFGELSPATVRRIRAITDDSTLDALYEAAIRASCTAEFESAVDAIG